MPISFEIDSRRRTLFTICYGKVTDSEMVSHLYTVAKARAYSLRLNHLVNCSDITLSEITADLVRSMAGKKLFASRSQCAIVAPQDYLYGMARMFELLHSGSVQVFREMMEAERWLKTEGSGYRPSSVNSSAARAKAG